MQPGNYQLYNDSELFSLVKEGDSSAFAQIYDRYWEVLFRHARRLTRDDNIAKDVVQDVFIKLWDKIEQTDINFSLRSYLYTSVRNNILNLIQHDKIRVGYLESLSEFILRGESITDYRVRERMLKEKIELEIQLLPVKMRRIFEMSRKENMSHKEIAENLDISDKTVKKQMSNAIKILRIKLGGVFTVIL